MTSSRRREVDPGHGLRRRLDSAAFRRAARRRGRSRTRRRAVPSAPFISHRDGRSVDLFAGRFSRRARTRLRSGFRPGRRHDARRRRPPPAARPDGALQRGTAALLDHLLPALSRPPRAGARQLPAGRDRRPRQLVAQGRHAAARRQLSGVAGPGPAHSARVHERQPVGTAAVVANRRGLRGASPSGSRPRSPLPWPGSAALLRVLRVTKSRAAPPTTR